MPCDLTPGPTRPQSTQRSAFDRNCSRPTLSVGPGAHACMEHTHSEEQTREEVGNGRDDRGGEGRRQASAGNAAAEKSGAIPPPRGVGVAADSPTSGFAATSAAEASAALPSPSGEAIDAQQHQQRQQQQKQQQKQQQRASAASSVAVEAAPETEDRVGGGGGGGGGRAAATSAPDIDHTSATTTTTATTTPTVTSGGGSRGATDAPPPNVAAHQGGARPGDSSSGIASGASTAERGEASSSHREPSHNTNVPAHQEEQPPLPATATAAVTAPTTRAMVPDKEDDDDDPAGGASAQRQHTLQNYASRDSGAVMLESSPASKGMSNLLVNSRDKYAISPCEDKQWAVLGLSEDIMVRTIRISSHEKYSSLVKDFQVCVLARSRELLIVPGIPLVTWLSFFCSTNMIPVRRSPTLCSTIVLRTRADVRLVVYCSIGSFRSPADCCTLLYIDVQSSDESLPVQQ